MLTKSKATFSLLAIKNFFNKNINEALLFAVLP